MIEHLRNKLARQGSRWLARRRARWASEEPVVSFTFDDFPQTALREGGEILGEFGCAGTYFACLGLAGEDFPSGRLFAFEDLPALLAAGHELGCHTFDHRHAWQTPADEFARSLKQNQEALRRVLPGRVFQTISFPLSTPHPRVKAVAEQHYVCCRGGEKEANGPVLDLNNLSAVFLEQTGGLEEAKQLIERNAQAGGWLIFATHDIGARPSRFGCERARFRAIVRHAKASGSAVLTVAEAARRTIACG